MNKKELRAKRLQGADAEHRQKVAEALAKASDWRGVCRVCGKALEGTLSELREHRHDQSTAQS